MKKKRTKPKGSGRKKGLPSKVIRIPNEHIKEVEQLIDRTKTKDK